MYVYLSKILPLFVMPLGVALILLLVALLFLRRGWKKTASGLLTVSVVGLWLGRRAGCDCGFWELFGCAGSISESCTSPRLLGSSRYSS